MKKVNVIFSLILLTGLTISSSVQVQAQETKRWNPQTRGTVIGAGTGAAAGAIIHKRNRVAGGVVGGVVGGATGYAIGKHKDNKNKEAARVAAANRAAADRAAAANRSTVATRRSSSTSKTAIASNNRNQVPANANGFNSNGSASMYNASSNSASQIYAAGFLPNPHYGDTSKPYYSSEYRRKSW